MKWTDENTENFSADELDILNAAQDILERETGLEPQTVADLLNNAWLPDDENTITGLCATVRTRLNQA